MYEPGRGREVTPSVSTSQGSRLRPRAEKGPVITGLLLRQPDPHRVCGGDPLRSAEESRPSPSGPESKHPLQPARCAASPGRGWRRVGARGQELLMAGGHGSGPGAWGTAGMVPACLRAVTCNTRGCWAGARPGCQPTLCQTTERFQVPGKCPLGQRAWGARLF